jgi:replicative DNA helicase
LETKNIAPEAIERIEAARKRKQRVTGIPSGIKAFDHKTSGFQKSDLILIAARPSQGKTAFALNIAANVVLSDDPKPVLFFSMEQSQQAIMDRLIAMKARVNLRDILTGFFPANRWSDVTNAAARFTEAPLYIVDTPGLNVLAIRTIARQLNSKLKRTEKKSLELIVVDYLQLIRGPSGRSESRQLEVAEISRSLKFLARDLNVPVIAVSQLSRGPEEKGRTDKKPLLGDLRDSGALEQDADLVAFIYRESYYKRNDPTIENEADIIIAKQRQGPVGDIKVSFIRDYLLFGDAVSDADRAEDDIEPSQAAFPDS